MKLVDTKRKSRQMTFELDPGDWKSEPPQSLLWMTQQMILIRAFEQALLDLKDKGLINGPVHTSVGEEATAAGVATALRPGDAIAGTHRAHHQYLAKALHACAAGGFNPLEDDFTPAMDAAVRELLCEVMGLADGCSGGRGGSMHLFKREYGIAGTNAIVGGGVPLATGYAWAEAFQQRDSVTVCFFGDGAVYQGVVHESMNLAALWRAPVIYFIENNQYAVGTKVADACSAERLADVAEAYGMPGVRVDGMNPLAVKLAVQEAVRRGKGFLPCVIEADVYRYYHHGGGVAGSAFGYRSKEEEAAWRRRDAIELCAGRLAELGLADGGGIQRLRSQAEGCVARAVASCTRAGANGVLQVREELWPAPESLMHGLRDERLAERGPFVEAEDLDNGKELTYAAAIAAVTGRWLEKDPRAFVLGEEVGNLGGGAYGATKGLPTRFPDRVRNTPITEAGFCGLAAGAALNGLHPVVELMFSSFSLVAADPLMNQIAQLAHVYGGHVELPIVVRTRVAIGLGYGAQHSLDPVALFALFPGWRIFVPTTPFDYIGLFNTAMAARSPTLIVEHQEFYGRPGQVPANDLDFRVAPRTAKVRRAGRDVTVVSYGWAVRQSLDAAELLAAEGVEAEVIDLRQLDDAGIDYETIGRSIAATGMLVTVEQAPRCNSVGGKIAAECQRRFFDQLDGPALSVNGEEAPLPVSRRLELLCMPTVAQVADTLRRAARRT